MVTNVTSLLKTVKAVEDEHTRGTRALESTIEAIGQEIRVFQCKTFQVGLVLMFDWQAFDSPEVPRVKLTPEDLVRVTKPITLATAKAVAAGNSGRQDDVIVAANVGRKAISDMLTTCKVSWWPCFHWLLTDGLLLTLERRVFRGDERHASEDDAGGPRDGAPVPRTAAARPADPGAPQSRGGHRNQKPVPRRIPQDCPVRHEPRLNGRDPQR